MVDVMSAPFEIIAAVACAPAFITAAALAFRSWLRARNDTSITVHVKREDGAVTVYEYTGKREDFNDARRCLKA